MPPLAHRLHRHELVGPRRRCRRRLRRLARRARCVLRLRAAPLGLHAVPPALVVELDVAHPPRVTEHHHLQPGRARVRARAR
eukprot:scaffold69466_cov36-Phaeocystis_antarctica.AAC.1